MFLKKIIILSLLVQLCLWTKHSLKISDQSQGSQTNARGYYFVEPLCSCQELVEAPKCGHSFCQSCVRHTSNNVFVCRNEFASYWKERLTLNSCLQLVNTRLRARRIRSCVKISHIKLIDQEDQQSKHKLPFKFSPKKEKIRREKTSKTASNHMYRRVYINANSKLSDRYRKRNV